MPHTIRNKSENLELDKIKAEHTIKKIKNKSMNYQFQVINTIYYIAKHHPHINKDMKEAMKIFKKWLDNYKKAITDGIDKIVKIKKKYPDFILKIGKFNKNLVYKKNNSGRWMPIQNCKWVRDLCK